MKKRLLSILLTACLLMGLLPATALAAEGDVKYLDNNSVVQTYTGSYTEITATDTPITWTAGWYVAQNNVTITSGGSTIHCTATGNGRLDAVATAIEQQTGMHFTLVHYSEHALDFDTNSRACSYVGLKWASGEETWGCGTHTDIIVAGIRALVSAINNK